MSDVWTETLRHLEEGNFTSLQDHLGGPEGFDRQIVKWFDVGQFADEQDALAEALSCAMMLGRTDTARYLIKKGVDPYAGMKTWLAGPHWAASSAQLETVKMLIEEGVPLEVENLYGGTVLGQALWSARNEHRPEHADIIEALLAAGAKVEPGTLEWWEEQEVPSDETRIRVRNALAQREFPDRPKQTR